MGIILASAGADEDVVIAGLLHDTIEDSSPEKKVTKAMLAERFGEYVAELVDDVTEQDQSRAWEVSKREALEHVAHLSHDALLVKSADTLSNVAELMDDHRKDGDATFDRFHASKADMVANYISVIKSLLTYFPESPLAADLLAIQTQLEKV